MNNNSSILFGLFDEFLWIRCSGRGSFANSPTVKSLGDDYIASGGRLIVIDLETCSGIDSTFMGTLAGLSRRLLPIGGSVQIASPSERCLSALESLGLDALLSIEPPTAPWRGKWTRYAPAWARRTLPPFIWMPRTRLCTFSTPI
ncbi:STAS domain-containing protein [Akkermansia massiliensis]